VRTTDERPEAVRRRRSPANVINFGIGPRGDGQELPRRRPWRASAAGQTGRPHHPHPDGVLGREDSALTGDLMAKIDRYLRQLRRPVRHAGTEGARRLLEGGHRRGGALAYMRGRTIKQQLHHPRRGSRTPRRSREMFSHPHRLRPKVVITGDAQPGRHDGRAVRMATGWRPS